MKKIVGTPFPKGRSGNPSGRPKLPRELVERAKAMSPEMLETLYSLARDKSQSGAVRVAAAEAVINRGHGKPTANIEVRRRDLSDMSDAELEAIIREAQPASTDERRPEGEPVH